ncbi:hypothetical protein [Tsukamurella paurometabola]|uniref:hypothetical protein n=1 Tax=Tsukamurella paurometabola TaxID=2061 RepID=UPI0013581A8D|nr:hypothetical protein [Tsukamurella paurometabola]
MDTARGTSVGLGAAARAGAGGASPGRAWTVGAGAGAAGAAPAFGFGAVGAGGGTTTVMVRGAGDDAAELGCGLADAPGLSPAPGAADGVLDGNGSKVRLDPARSVDVPLTVHAPTMAPAITSALPPTA